MMQRSMFVARYAFAGRNHSLRRVQHFAILPRLMIDRGAVIQRALPNEVFGNQ
jgi:hypothetical protein